MIYGDELSFALQSRKQSSKEANFVAIFPTRFIFLPFHSFPLVLPTFALCAALSCANTLVDLLEDESECETQRERTSCELALSEKNRTK